MGLNPGLPDHWRTLYPPINEPVFVLDKECLKTNNCVQRSEWYQIGSYLIQYNCVWIIDFKNSSFKLLLCKNYYHQELLAQSAGAEEYTDCTFAEG